MQPNERRTRLTSATLARGRMFLKAEWGWLPGFPGQSKPERVAWVTVPREGEHGVQRVELNHESLHRATYTRTKLIRHFRRVLPRLVEDVAWWRQGTAHILNWLKGAIHDHRPLPASLLDEENAFSPHAIRSARSLVAQDPRLRPIVNALTWVAYLTPPDFLAGVKWCRDNAVVIKWICHAAEPDDRIVEPLVLWELTRRVGARRTHPLLVWLAEPRADTCAVSAGNFKADAGRAVNALRDRSGEMKAIDRVRSLLSSLPEDTAGKPLRQFAHWLLRQDGPTARRALDLIGILFPLQLYDEWELWWGKVRDVRRRVDELKDQDQISTCTIHSICKSIEGLARSLPPSFYPQVIIAAGQAASAPVRRPLYSTLLASLKALPVVEFNLLLRAAFLVHWLDLEQRHGKKLLPFLREFRRYQATDVEPDRLYGPWREVLAACETGRPPWSQGPSDSLLESLATSTQWRRALETLARCILLTADPVDDKDADWALSLARYSGSVEQACERYLAIGPSSSRPLYPINNRIELADQLAVSAEDFASLYSVLYKSDALARGDLPRLIRLHEQLQAAGWDGLLRAVIHDQKLGWAVSLIRLMKVCAAVAQPALPPPAPIKPEIPLWAAPYPDEVQESLAALNALTPGADAAARRVLKFLFFEPDRFDAEIQAIESLLAVQPDDDRLQRRLAHLRERRANPTPPEPKKIRKGIERIECFTRTVVLFEWRQSLERKLRDALPIFLKATGDASALLEERHLAAFAVALELPGPSKALALELYRRRCGPPPWDMRDHPANASFVRCMTARGLKLAPWLERRGPDRWTAHDGTGLTIGFEEDPLEIFQMGTYFDTCLAPDGCSFFSVFANAADVNKKILFARDSHGRIVGRCLIAISDAGGILTFHPYCHDGKFGFADYVREAAQRLAKEMGTFVVTDGPVATLVSTEWYDDGSVDLCGRFPCLEDGSAYRKVLLTVTLSDLKRLTAEAFAPLPLGSLTLSMLLELPELETRPELVLPLLPELEHAQGLTVHQWRRVIAISSQAGARSFATKMTHQQFIPAILKEHRREQCIDVRLLDTVTEIDSSAAIRVVRMTRPRGVRRDEEEDNDRKRVLATALKLLGRCKKAEILQSRDRDANRS